MVLSNQKVVSHSRRAAGSGAQLYKPEPFCRVDKPYLQRVQYKNHLLGKFPENFQKKFIVNNNGFLRVRNYFLFH